MGDVLQFPSERVVNEQPVGKRAMAKLIGRSPRWLQQATNEWGCPHERLGNNYLRYYPSDVRSWLREREEGAA